MGFDTYNNKYDYIPKDFDLKVSLVHSDGHTSLELCDGEKEKNKSIFICRDSKGRKDWKFLLNDEYTLKIENISPDKDAEKSNNIISYKIKVVDGDIDDNASNAEVDLSKTVFSTNRIFTISGEEKEFSVEIRTI